YGAKRPDRGEGPGRAGPRESSTAGGCRRAAPPPPRAAWQGRSARAAVARAPSRRGLRERGTLEHLAEREHRPLLLAAAKCAGEIAFAARHRGRRIPGELALREAPEAEHLIHQQPRGDFAVIHHHHARVARDRRHT